MKKPIAWTCRIFQARWGCIERGIFSPNLVRYIISFSFNLLSANAPPLLWCSEQSRFYLFYVCTKQVFHSVGIETRHSKMIGADNYTKSHDRCRFSEIWVRVQVADQVPSEGDKETVVSELMKFNYVESWVLQHFLCFEMLIRFKWLKIRANQEVIYLWCLFKSIQSFPGITLLNCPLHQVTRYII